LRIAVGERACLLLLDHGGTGGLAAGAVEKRRGRSHCLPNGAECGFAVARAVAKYLNNFNLLM
jgi:hypothetical protein